MYHFKINPIEGLIIQVLKGNVTTHELKSLFLDTREDELFSDSYSIVMDFRDAEIKLTLEEINNASLYYRKNCTLLGKRAILVNRSLETAKLHLFRDRLHPQMSFSVFSTIEAASVHMGISLNKHLEEDIPVREDVYL